MWTCKPKQKAMRIKAQIPNIITLLNLLSGCFALIFAFHQDFKFAFLFVALGIFLDFFDGFFARLFKVSSPLGLQLDSLADMVTSGVVPGVVMYQLMNQALGFPSFGWPTLFFPFLGFIITLGSCYRLANFNVDTRQTDSFIGLPTPANALVILSLPLILADNQFEFITNALSNEYILLAISLLSAYILNAEIPLFSLKIKSMSFAKNKLQIFFLAVSLLLLIFFKALGIPLLIIFYVILSLLTNKKNA